MPDVEWPPMGPKHEWPSLEELKEHFAKRHRGSKSGAMQEPEDLDKLHTEEHEGGGADHEH